MSTDPRSKRHQPTKFKVYDAYSFGINPYYTYPGCPNEKFFSKAAIDKVGDRLGVKLTYDVSATFHFARPDPNAEATEGGWIHTDNEAQRFHDRPVPDGPLKGVNFSTEPTAPLKRRRAIAGLFYLNDNWKPGQGGETEFYTSRNPKDVLETIAPIGNRLVLFVMGETSFHRALPTKVDRDVMVFWYHADEASGVNIGDCFLPGGVFANGG